jgi:hypothetical protein
LSGDKVVWEDREDVEHGQTEVYLYDLGSGTTTRVTNNATDDWLPETDGRYVSWHAMSADWQAGTTMVYDCVTGQTYSLGLYPYASSPHLDSGRLVFSQGPGERTQEVWTAAFPIFSDVPVGHQYFAPIQGLAERGLIGGYPQADGSTQFRPTNSVLRAQFAKMIDGALGIFPKESMAPPFAFTDLGPDVPTDLYPHEYVWAAYSKDIIKGYSDGSFKPFTPIIRGHVVTMTVRALQQAAPPALVAPPAGFAQSFGLDLAPEHKANARLAESNGLLEGLPVGQPGFDAAGAMPRGEVAQVMWNMMKKMRLLGY